MPFAHIRRPSIIVSSTHYSRVMMASDLNRMRRIGQMFEFIRSVAWWLAVGAAESLSLAIHVFDPTSMFRLDPISIARLPPIVGLLIWCGLIYVLFVVMFRRRNPLGLPRTWTQAWCAIGLLGFFVFVGERQTNSRHLNSVMYWRGSQFDENVWAQSIPNGTYPVELRSLMVGALASKGRVLGRSKAIVAQQIGLPQRFEGADCFVYDLGKTSCRFRWGVGTQAISLRIEFVNDSCTKLSLIEGGIALFTVEASGAP